jgi:hypothetical protein
MELDKPQILEHLVDADARAERQGIATRECCVHVWFWRRARAAGW